VRESECVQFTPMGHVLPSALDPRPSALNPQGFWTDRVTEVGRCKFRVEGCIDGEGGGHATPTSEGGGMCEMSRLCTGLGPRV